MDLWWIVASVVGGWSMLSVLAGVVVGHAIAEKPLRRGLPPVRHGAGVVTPLLREAAAARRPISSLDSA